MSRIRFFRIRLGITVALLLLAYAIVRFLWFPGAYYPISGISTQFWVLVAVVIVVGPILTTFVFKPGKKGLGGDLVILAGIELAAIVAAMALIYSRQPYFAVFALDRFVAVSLPELVDADLAREQFGNQPGQHPRLVFANLPEDTERMQRLIDETVLMGMADIDRRPEFWAPYASGVADVLIAARPLSEIIEAGDDRSAVIEAWLAAEERSADAFLILPLRGRAGDAAVVISASTGYPVATLEVDAWPSAPEDSPPASDVEQTH